MLRQKEILITCLKELDTFEKGIKTQREILTNGLRELDNLEKGIKEKKIVQPSRNSYTLKDLMELEEKYRKITNHHDDDDDVESQFDEILIPDEDDIFDKKHINVNISTNIGIIKVFPNALLVENGRFSSQEKADDFFPQKNEKKSEVQDNNTTKNNMREKSDDIWDILNQIEKENKSESLDTLTTESDITTDTLDKNDISNSIIDIVCKGCSSKGTLIEDQHTSVIVCSDCGMINEELLDHGPEWRQYNNDDNRGDGVNRCGCPSNFFFPKSSQGTIMVGTGNSRLKRKQKWNSMVYKERSLNQVFEYISLYCTKNHIPRIIVDSAKILYKRLSDCKHKTGPNIGKQIIIRGENRLSIIAACVFKACEINKNPRNVKEIAEIFVLDEKKVTKGIKQFDRIMKNADDNNNIIIDQFDTNTAEDYIRRHCPKLKIGKDATNLAVKISQNCCKMKLASDHNPHSIAAGSILVAVQFLDLNIDRKSIASLFGTSDVTIGTIYNKIAPFAEALVDDEATEHIIKKFKING